MTDLTDLNKNTLRASWRQQATVTITDDNGTEWTGVVTGLIDEPALLLTQPSGQRVMLPQRFRARLKG